MTFINHLRSLDIFQVKERYLFLLMTQQRLWSHVHSGSYDTGLQILRQCLDHCGDNFRVNTWNCVYQVLWDLDGQYLPEKDKLLTFISRKSNYMTNSLDGRRSNRVNLVESEDNERSTYKWSQVRDIIVGGQEHGRGVTQPCVMDVGKPDVGERNEIAASESHASVQDSDSGTSSEKPVWQWIEDGFDLKVLNYERINLTRIRGLFHKVTQSTVQYGKKNKTISTQFVDAFQQWLNHPDRLLAERAYALLSNWFLTGKKDAKDSQIAHSAQALWNELFCCVPTSRLTSPESGKNHKILLEAFVLWWPKQEACQKRGR